MSGTINIDNTSLDKSSTSTITRTKRISTKEPHSHFFMTTPPSVKMSTSASHIFEIDVGTPPYFNEGWETFRFNFHAFESLSTQKGIAVDTTRFTSCGHEWWLKLYPGGREEATDGMMSIYLCRKSVRDDTVTINYAINIKVQNDCFPIVYSYLSCQYCQIAMTLKFLTYIFFFADKDADGQEDTNHASRKIEFASNSWCKGWSNFAKRSHITDSSNNILVDGTLVVELQMKSFEKTNLPRQPFVPNNPFAQKMQQLHCSGHEYADVLFTFPHEEIGGEVPKCHAHRVVLQTCAPALAELCEHCTISSPVPLTNVKYDIFCILLDHVYGLRISVSNWKIYSREIIDAADWFGVTTLKLEAEAWYVKLTTITSTNVIDLLAYADAKNCALLKECVMDYLVRNGKDALQCLSFDTIPESRSLFTDLLLAVSVRNDGGEDDDDDTSAGSRYKSMRISGLRRELDKLGLDVDGSREVLIKRLEGETGDK